MFIINTNKQSDPRYEQEMLDNQKCAAYRSTKTVIEDIKIGDLVLLYGNKKGIIARGIADGVVRKKEDKGEEDAEYYMSLNEFSIYKEAITYNEIREIIQIAIPSFNKPFGVTALKFEYPASEVIWNEVCKQDYV